MTRNLCAMLLALCCAASALSEDIVTLESGNEVRGQIVLSNERAITVRVGGEGGFDMVFLRNQIRSINGEALQVTAEASSATVSPTAPEESEPADPAPQKLGALHVDPEAAPQELTAQEASRLLTDLKSETPLARAQAAHRLGVCQYVPAIPDLCALLGDTALVVEIQIGLGQETPVPVAYVAAAALRDIGRPALEAMIKSLPETEHEKARRELVTGIGRVDDPRVLPVLDRVLRKDADAETRHRAILVLARNPAPEAAASLTYAALHDPDAGNRAAVPKEMGKRNEPALIEALIQSMRRERNERLVSQYVYALGRIQAEIAFEPLVEVLRRARTQQLQMACLAALGDLGDARAVPAVRTILEQTEDDLVRYSAEQALLRLEAGQP